MPQNTIENGEHYGVYIGLRPDGLKQILENYLKPNFFLPYKYGSKYLWICVNDNLDPDHPDFPYAINLGIILKFLWKKMWLSISSGRPWESQTKWPAERRTPL